MKNKKYIILFIAAIIIEIASTFYISAVSDKDLTKMVFWAFIGPFLGLPFLKYQIEAKTDLQRLKLAICYGLGYAFGAFIVNICNNI
jgi:hypothetical protein